MRASLNAENKSYRWTEERIALGIHILNDSNVSIADGDVIRDPTHPSSKILSRAVGAKVSTEGLHRAACRRFGTWTLAVRKAGIRPPPQNDQKIFWRKTLVLQSIVALVDDRAPILPPWICKDRTPHAHPLFYRDKSARADRILQKVTGQKTTRQALYRASLHYFGSWERAVEVALVKPDERWHVHFWTQPRIIAAIRALYAAGIPLNVGKIFRDKSPITARLLKVAVGKATTGGALYAAGRVYFPSWDHALRAAGVSYSQIRQKSFWNRMNIVAGIQALHKYHIPLNSAQISKDVTLETKRILSRAISQPRTGRSLAGAAQRIFGSWDHALIVAGIDPKEVRLHSFRWDKYALARLIRALHAVNVSLVEKRFCKDKSKKTRSLIFRMSGRRIQTHWIHKVALWKFGSWEEAVKYALDPKVKVILKNEREEATEDLALFLRRLYDDGFELNHQSVWKKSKLILNHNQTAYGENVSGFILVKAANKYLGSWDNALRAAHLDPLDIRKRARNHTASLSVTPHQVERVILPDGSVRKSAFAGPAPKTPDQMIEENELSERLSSAMDELNGRDREAAEEIYDLILKIPGFLGQRELIQAVVRLSNGSLKENTVRSVLSKLAQSSSLSPSMR